MARWGRLRQIVFWGFPRLCLNSRTPCSVATSRSSNRTGGFPASGSPTGFTAGPTITPYGAPFHPLKHTRIHRAPISPIRDKKGRLGQIPAMPRTARIAQGGMVFHVLNRAGTRLRQAARPAAAEGGVGGRAEVGCGRPPLRQRGVAGDGRSFTWRRSSVGQSSGIISDFGPHSSARENARTPL